MSEFDDPDLGRRLRAAAGSSPDLASAQQSVQRRVVRARRRRMAVASGAAAVVLVSLGAVSAMNRDNNRGQFGTSPSETAPDISSDLTDPTATADPTATDSGAPGTTVTTVEPAASTSTDPTITSAPSSSAPTTPPAPGTSVAPVGPTPSAPSTVPTTPAPPPSSVDTTAAPAGEQTFSTTGGSIRVRLEGGQLQLVGVSPNSGFVVGEQEASPSEVEVRFESATLRSKVTVRLVGGAMVPEYRDEPADSSGAEQSTSSSEPDDD